MRHDIRRRNGLEIPVAFIVHFLQVRNQGISHISRGPSPCQDDLDIVMLLPNFFLRKLLFPLFFPGTSEPFLSKHLVVG